MGNMGMAISEMAEKLERMDRRTQVEPNMEQAGSPQRPMSMPPGDVHPESMAEARRELTLIGGALQSLSATVGEVESRLVDYMRDDEPSTVEKVAEVPMPVRTPYGRSLRQSYEEVNRIDRRLQTILRLMEL